MIDIIIKKIIRLIRSDRKIQLKLGGILVLLIVVMVQMNIMKKREKELARVRKENEMVGQISKMEKEIKFQDLKNLTPEKQIAAIKRILEGTSYRYGVYQAIINGHVYSIGSVIGDYTITKITMETITLENKQRREIQKLYFPEEYLGDLNILY